MVLLVAIIAAIALTLRRRKDSRYQDPAAQIRARKEDRLRVIKMAPVGTPSGGDVAAQAAPETKA